jgi:hypothetical protein
MFRYRAGLPVTLARGGVFALLPAVALAQSAPSFQLIDLGFEGDNTSLQWLPSPPAAFHPGHCPSLGGTGPSYETAVSGPLMLAVGWSPTAQGTLHAIVCALPPFTYFKDLGVLDGGPNSYATNIANSAPNIVGYSQTNLAPVSQDQGKTVTLAFVSSGNSPIKALLSAMNNPHYSSQANAVNDAGEVVGVGEMLFTSGQESGLVGNRAMLWEPNGQVYNLQFYLAGSPGFTLTSATMINCHGDIAAYGYAPGDDITNPGGARSFLLVRQNPIGSCSQTPPGPP